MADFTGRPVAIVRQGARHDRDTSRPVALVVNLFQCGRARVTRRLFNRSADIVIGHVIGLGAGDRVPQERIRLGISASASNRNLQFTAQF